MFNRKGVGKIYSEKSIQELSESVEDKMTDFKIKKLFKDSIGKWIEAKGFVVNVYETLFPQERIPVLIEEVTVMDSFYRVSLAFENKEDFETLENMDIGDYIEAEGKINEIDASNIRLVNCELKKHEKKG